jgi:RNA polymerase sigma-70 factor
MTAQLALAMPDTQRNSELEARIDEMYAGGLEHHGYLGLSPSAFRSRVMEIALKWTDSDQGALRALDRLVSPDLYLATACSAQCEAAWVRFFEEYGLYLRQSLCKLCREAWIIEDLLDVIYVDLFLPDSTGRSRIGSYDGRASLTTWLRVIVSNRITNERNRKSNALRSDVQVEGEKHGEHIDIDRLLDARRHYLTITECLTQAWQSLAPRERLMILSRYEQELQLDEIGRLWGIHPSTVNRQLDRALAKVRREVSKRLVSRLRLSERALNQLTSAFAVESVGGGLLARFRELREAECDEPPKIAAVTEIPNRSSRHATA